MPEAWLVGDGEDHAYSLEWPAELITHENRWSDVKKTPLYSPDSIVDEVVALWNDSLRKTLEGEAEELRNGADRDDVADMMNYVAKKFEIEVSNHFRGDSN